ncbi:hypothetical protein MASSI9I_60369 [Massilia sp. 9I]|nr:hypothetical protein MASSI9I_60369 [Massilia sp. 9I]
MSHKVIGSRSPVIESRRNCSRRALPSYERESMCELPKLQAESYIRISLMSQLLAQ